MIIADCNAGGNGILFFTGFLNIFLGDGQVNVVDENLGLVGGGFIR